MPSFRLDLTPATQAPSGNQPACLSQQTYKTKPSGHMVACSTHPAHQRSALWVPAKPLQARPGSAFLPAARQLFGGQIMASQHATNQLFRAAGNAAIACCCCLGIAIQPAAGQLFSGQSWPPGTLPISCSGQLEVPPLFAAAARHSCSPPPPSGMANPSWDLTPLPPHQPAPTPAQKHVVALLVSQFCQPALPHPSTGLGARD